MSASTDKKKRLAEREAGTDKWTAAEKKNAEKKQKMKKRYTLTAIITAVVLVLIILLNSSFLYTTPAAVKINRSNEESVVTGSTGYSAAMLQYLYVEAFYDFYNSYGAYASYFGLDLSSGIYGLANQQYSEDMSWADYFMETAISNLTQYTALCDYAKENGISLDADDNAEIDAEIQELKDYAKDNGMSLKTFLRRNYGNNVNAKLLREAMEMRMLSNKAYTAFADTLEYTDAELEEHYSSFAGSRDVFDYAYYLVSAEKVETAAADGTTSSAVTDETMAAAYAEAEAIAEAYAVNKGSEFKRLDTAVKSVDADASATEMTGVTGSSISSYYSEWLMGSRNAGDINIVEYADNGYYVVVFGTRNDNHYNMACVRHLLIAAEADEDGNYTDEAKAAAKARVEELRDQWLADGGTEEALIALIAEYSDDSADGYYEVAKNQMVEEFDAFCFAGHKPGDYDIVYGESSAYCGYHLVYYIGDGPLYSSHIAEDDLKDAAVDEWLTNLIGQYSSERTFFYRFAA